MTHPPITGFLEAPESQELWDRFVGDQAFSPLANMLLVLDQEAMIQATVVEAFAELPSWLELPRKAHLVEKREKPAFDRIALARRFAPFSPPSTNHGLAFLSEFCTFGNPGHALAHLEAFEANHPTEDYQRASMVLLLGAHQGFMTSDALQILIEQAERRDFHEHGFIAEGPRGIFPALWQRYTLQELMNEGLSAAHFFQRIGCVRGNLLGPSPTFVKLARHSFNLREAGGHEFAMACAKRLQERDTDFADLDLKTLIEVADDVKTHPLPSDLEIEICAERPLPAPYLPRPSEGKSAMAFADFEKLIGDLTPEDGVVLTLGGFGDPLLHPELDAFLEFARPRVAGLAIRTFELSKANFERLKALDVDVISWRFGAWGKAWAGINGIEGETTFEASAAALLEIAEPMKDDWVTRPMLIPEVIKCREGDKTLLDFYAFCEEARLHLAITSMQNFGGAITSDQVLTPVARTRKACLRLEEQMTILCDGQVLACTPMAGGDEGIGNAFESSVREVWQGQQLREMRQMHKAGTPEKAHPQCGDCSEWCRLG